MDNISVEELWDNLVEFGIATEDELSLITAINGYNIEALEDVLYVRTSFESWDAYINEINEY